MATETPVAEKRPYDSLRLPEGYTPALPTPRARAVAVALAQDVLTAALCRRMRLLRVPTPLLIRTDTGLQDGLDRDGSRKPVSVACGLKEGHVNAKEYTHPEDASVEAEVVQAATKWKRLALVQYECEAGEGVLCSPMLAIRKDYKLDHDHSAFVDQWDWELAIDREQRNVATLLWAANEVWQSIREAHAALASRFPQLATPGGGSGTPSPRGCGGGGFDSEARQRSPTAQQGTAASWLPASASEWARTLPETPHVVYADELYAEYPTLDRKAREEAALRKHGAIVLVGIGAPLGDGVPPHENRAVEYDDWITPNGHVAARSGRECRGLNADILVWNAVTQRRHELSSMGVRVDAAELREQAAMCGAEDAVLSTPYSRAILDGAVPSAVGGGVGMSRTIMWLLRCAHLGEVQVAPWPDELLRRCEQANIHVLT